MINFERLNNDNEIYRICKKCDNIYIGHEDFCSMKCKNNYDKYLYNKSFKIKKIKRSKENTKHKNKVRLHEILKNVDRITIKDILKMTGADIDDIRKLIKEHLDFFYLNLITTNLYYEDLYKDELIDKGWIWRPLILKHRPSFAHYESKLILEIRDDYFSCNPKYFPKNFYHPQLEIMAIEKWYKDYKKIKKWEKLGWTTIIMWSSEIEEIKEIINNDKII